MGSQESAKNVEMKSNPVWAWAGRTLFVFTFSASRDPFWCGRYGHFSSFLFHSLLKALCGEVRANTSLFNFCNWRSMWRSPVGPFFPFTFLQLDTLGYPTWNGPFPSP
jgi:hypothetical protein